MGDAFLTDPHGVILVATENAADVLAVSMEAGAVKALSEGCRRRKDHCRHQRSLLRGSSCRELSAASRVGSSQPKRAIRHAPRLGEHYPPAVHARSQRPLDESCPVLTLALDSVLHPA